MEKKILFVDLDGTLLNDQKEITPENRAAIEKATALGHAVVVTTGRPLVSTRKQVERLGLTFPGCYAITSNGALIYDTYEQKTIFYQGVSQECIRPIFREADRFGVHPQTYDDTHVICEHDNREIQYYSRSTLIPYRVVPDAAKAITKDPIKLLFIDLDDRKHLENFRQQVKPLTDKYNLDMFFSCDYYLECLPKGINKGSGVRFLSQLLNVPLENTVAAGDAENDISMLVAAGTACVMKNAGPEMAPYADYITERDNNHSGIAEILERFFLS